MVTRPKLHILNLIVTFHSNVDIKNSLIAGISRLSHCTTIAEKSRYECLKNSEQRQSAAKRLQVENYSTTVNVQRLGHMAVGD